jgi:N-sulfoglucosamine sulfohydrolase
MMTAVRIFCLGCATLFCTLTPLSVQAADLPNIVDRQRKDFSGAYWDSWDEAAKADAHAAEIIRRYYTRPEFELFDLVSEPHELINLAESPRHASRLASLRAELAAWAESQEDDLQTHRDPYLTTKPLSDLAPKKRN